MAAPSARGCADNGLISAARKARRRARAGRGLPRPAPGGGRRRAAARSAAALTAYQPDRQLRDRVKAALATLTTQGRAVGFCVIAVVQDPRKEVMSIRN